MATVTDTYKKCDVFKQTKNIRSFEVVLLDVTDSVDGNVKAVAIYEESLDMCPNALKRLLKLVDEGVHPCGWEPEKDEPLAVPKQAEDEVEDASEVLP